MRGREQAYSAANQISGIRKCKPQQDLMWMEC